jgi:hypothetical protein
VSLQEWQRNGWLVAHQTSRQEVADLLAVVDRDLADARTPGLSPDWRLSIAYNAALQAAAAALAAAGFRPSRESHHFRVIHSLQFTVRPGQAVIQQFDMFRKKRIIGGYERAGTVSDQEAKEMLTLAEQVKAQTIKWLRAEHPQLSAV